MSAVIYPGSFDPVTKGHLDVITRLSKMFSRVVVLVADSSRKKNMFSSEERVQLIREALGAAAGVEVLSSSDLTVNVARKENICIIARSARTTADWEFEYALADANKKLAPEIETLFVMADSQFGFISSSLVREIALFGGDTSAFVTNNVKIALKSKTK